MRRIVQDDRAVFGALDRDECLMLLRWEEIGRLAVAEPGCAPLVVPLNFLVVDDMVHFRCDLGGLALRLFEQPVSFQVDRVDTYRRIGWSVLVQGTAQLLTADEEAELGLRPEPWAPGERPLLVRIVTESITGRRIELHDRPLDDRAYR